MNEDIFPTWKQEYIRGLEESLAFFRRESKAEREKWVARRLIAALGVTFDEGEIKRGQEEPADVLFRDAHFQVKEMLDEGRKRTKEFIEKLERAKSAQSFGELLEHYEPQYITFAEIVQRCANYASSLLYGPHERKNMDLLCYFNYVDYHETNTLPINKFNEGFRSFSVVSNRFCAVLDTASDAPCFLSENEGRIIKIY